MALEIERKFLVREVPANLSAYPHARIVQGYVAASPGGNEVRLRQKGSHFFLTVKSGASIVRAEYEVELTPEQFEALWPSVGKQYLKKTRFDIPYGGFTIELDVYEGPLAGLRTVEVEFTDEAACLAFTPPNWFGPDITTDARYRNRRLALHGLPQDGLPQDSLPQEGAG